MNLIIRDKTIVKHWNQLLTNSKYLKGDLEDARITGILKLDFEKVDKYVKKEQLFINHFFVYI